jgi:hypothetical protein
VPLADLPCVVSRVDPLPHLKFEGAAFAALSSDRAIGFGRGPIPWRSIYSYGERYRMDVDEFDRFAETIRAMDVAYLDYFNKSET